MKLKIAAGLAAFALACPAAFGEEAQPSWIAGIADETLTAVDDSTVMLSPMEGRLVLDFAAHGGESQKTTFAFVSDRMGTVADDDAAGGKPDGFFRLTEVGLEIQYDDGNTASLFANVDNGLTMKRRGTGGETVCVSWYPKAHVFSEAERRAAVAAYAERLGVHEDAPPPAAPAPKKRSHVTHAVPVANICSPAMQPSRPPVEVRSAAVHTVDAPPPAALTAPAPSPSPAAAAAPAAAILVVPAGHAAPDCLSLEVQGAYIGFHNRCGNEVQVAYCLEKAADPAITCGTGTRIGAVAAYGFIGTFADSTAAEHDTRWIACSGGAGDVAPRLDRADPPAGSCVKKSP